MCSTDFEGMSKRVAQNNRRPSLSVCAEEGEKTGLEVIAERDDFLVLLNGCKMSKGKFGTKTIGTRCSFNCNDGASEAVRKEAEIVREWEVTAREGQ